MPLQMNAFNLVIERMIFSEDHSSHTSAESPCKAYTQELSFHKGIMTLYLPYFSSSYFFRPSYVFENTIWLKKKWFGYSKAGGQCHCCNGFPEDAFLLILLLRLTI